MLSVYLNKLMKVLLSSPWPYRIIRFLIGAVFFYAGITKLTDINAFANIILQYNIVPESVLIPVAFGLPLLEVIAGAGLILNIRGSRTAIIGMLVLFIAILWYGILKDLDIDCGCFAPEEILSQNSLRNAFYRDLIMLGAMIFLFLDKRFCPSQNIKFDFWSKIKSIRGGI